MIFTRPFVKARSVNATNTSFASKVATLTEPSGDAGTATGASVLQLSDGPNGIVPCKALLIPYGTGDANDVFDMRIIGWRRVGSGPRPDVLWIPHILASLTCTIGAATGVAASPVVATELFVDTITILSEPTITADTTRQGTVMTYSPANDTIAWAIVDLQGCEKLELTFDTTTGDPTGANCLVALM